MKKLTFSLLLSFALSTATAYAQTNPPAATIVTDSRLSHDSVSINVGTYGGPLSSLLAAVAHSAKYDILFDTNVDALTTSATPAAGGAATATQTAPLVYNFANTPFNQVWPLLMDTYSLSYDVVNLGNKKVLRVTNKPIQSVVKLKYANAEAILNQIKLSFGNPSYSKTVSSNSNAGEQNNNDSSTNGGTFNTGNSVNIIEDVKLDSPTLRIVADARTNSIIIRGTSREIREVETAIANIDVPVGATADGGNRRVYNVLGSAAEIQKLLHTQFPQLSVQVVGNTNQLIISGNKNAVQGALDFLAEVDKPANGDIQQRVFPLSNANAVDLKKVLESTLARDIAATTGLPSTAATSAVNPTTGGVVTTPVTSAASTNAQAQQIAAQADAASQTAPAAGAATIIADERTNTLVVRGTARQVQQVADLIPQLDQRVAQLNLQVHIMEINRSVARTLGLSWKGTAGSFNVVTNTDATSTGFGGISALFNPTMALVKGFNILPTLNALESQGNTKSVYDGIVTMQSGQRNLAIASPTEDSTSSAAAVIQSGGTIQLNIPGSGGSAPIQKALPYGLVLSFYNPQVAPDGQISVRVFADVSTLQSSATSSPQNLDFATSKAHSTITFKAGETVMLGGLLSTEDKDTAAGLPFLSSLPVIGNAFKTTNRSSKETQLLVVITGTLVK